MPGLYPADRERRLDRSGEEDPLHQRRPRSRSRRPRRARRRRVVHGAADRRAESRHAHRGRSGAAARSAAERRFPVDHAGLFPRARHHAASPAAAFDASDRANTPPVLVVNQALVDKYFDGRDPIGHVILFGGNKRHEIVGVVADARYRSVEQPADPTFYLPLEQNDERWPFLAFTVWTDGSASGDHDGRHAAPAARRQCARPIRSSRSRGSAPSTRSCRASMAAAAIQHVDRRAVRGDRVAAGGGRHLRRDGVRRHEPDARARRARRPRRGAGGSDQAWCSGRDCC